MKTMKIIPFVLIALSFVSVSQAFAWGEDKLFPDKAIELGIRGAVFRITEKYSDWDETTKVVDIEIHQKYRTNQKKLQKLKQKYYQEGIEVPSGVRKIFSKIGLYKSNDDFQEELISVVFTANFIAKGKKHKIIGNFVFTKYPQDDEITYLHWIVIYWKDKNPNHIDTTNYDEFLQNAKSSNNIFEEIIVLDE